MFENNENLVAGEAVTENTEETVEETLEQVEVEPDESQEEEKVYTKKEFEKRLQETLDKKIPRLEAKLRKEYEKDRELVEVLKAGTGSDDVEEVTGVFRKHYEEKGIKIPTKPNYSERDIKTLAAADAKEIIGSGFDEVTEELNRLTELGVQNMSAREKEMYLQLAEYHKTASQSQELEKIGVTEEVYGSKEFKDFASQFNKNVPVTKIYELYNKTLPKKEIKQPGSMKSTAQEGGVKDYYSYEEASKFTREELRKNPELFKAVERSMPYWGKKK